MDGYCCLFQRLEDYIWVVSLLPAVALFVILSIGIRRRRDPDGHGALHWWADRIAASTFVLGAILFLLEVWHGAEEAIADMPMGLVGGIGFTLWTATPQTACFCAVTLAGIGISMTLKKIEKGRP